MASGSRWFGDAFGDKLRKQESRMVDAAGRVLRDHIRKKISRSQPTKGAGVKKIGLSPSKSLEYPKIVLGHLRRNIQAEHDKESRTSRVGTNVKYGRYLELGTRRMGRRPWLSSGLREAMSKMAAVMKRMKKL